MSEEETFIARWSRRKREAEKDGEAVPKMPAGAEPASPEPPDRQGGVPLTPERREARAVPTVDLPSLPPLESITSATDIRAFLQSGVPPELSRAALRRAWAADPAIRDFVEIAENQWDFANPASVPGFGPLTASDDVRQLVAQALGKLGDETPAAALQDDAGTSPAAIPNPHQPASKPTEPAGPGKESIAESAERPEAPAPQGQLVQDPDRRPAGAVQHDTLPNERGPMPNRRSHGSAIPQ